jgi:hypothetical protein
MKVSKYFDEYLKMGIVKKTRGDVERAKSLINQSERKINSLKEKIEKLTIKNENANDYVEYCYDTIMLLIRAKLLLDGYNASGQGAHEAEVSYLRILGFKEIDVQFLDKLRFFRNGILYYGTILDAEYAQMVIDFSKKIYPKLIRILEK